jgi:hypothetical protein
MTMGPPTIVGIGITVLSSALLAVLAAVWLQNYREFRSPMILGLLGFSGLLLLENLIAIAFFFSRMKMLYAADPLVGQVVLGMRIIELLAVGLLTYATLQ